MKTFSCRFNASARAADIDAANELAAAVSSELRWKVMKLGAANVNMTASTAKVTISSISVNPDSRRTAQRSILDS